MSWDTALDRQIHDYLPDLKWAADEPMAKHTSFRIGGPAKRMAFPKTREQLVVLMGFLQDAGVKPLLIGNGTNLLITDGAGTLTCGGETVKVKKGESYFIPAGSGKYAVTGDCETLVTVV